MHRTFVEIVTRFAQQNGCLCEVDEGQCRASLTVEGLDIHLGLIEASGMLIIQTGVGILPDANREAFMLDLLTANNLYSGTTGLTLGVDKEIELVTLQLVWEMIHLDQARFDTLMGNVLSQAGEWLHRLATWKAPAAESHSAVESEPKDPKDKPATMMWA